MSFVSFIGAVKCLRASLTLNPSFIDSKIKLGSLLVDMDELEEARHILSNVGDENLEDPIVLLHLAELNINDNDYDEAVSVLRQAQRVCRIYNFKFTLKSETITTLEKRLNSKQNNKLSLNNIQLLKMKEKHDERIEKINSICEIGTDLLCSSIYVLLGVALFRNQPANPEIALRTLQSGQREHPNCINILLSLGEVMGQAGDLVNALKKFQQAWKLVS
jgi:tetratricopeptide (TPR) repeat protein